MDQSFTIILYYKYVEITEPALFVKSHKEVCSGLGLTGRVLISAEGINGTLEGTTDAIEKYISIMRADARFVDIEFKKSVGNGAAFPRLRVKERKEIVTLGLPPEEDVDPRVTTGKYIEPEELHAWIHNGKKNFTIVDMRNDYEHKLGHFEGSVLPKMEFFRDLPKAVGALEPLKEQTVVTVCTGGVRCEKASGYLLKKGFKDVYQLHGGIVTYMEKFKNDDFKGKLYVFDNRLAMTFTEDERRTVVGRCDICRTPSEDYMNCSNPSCHSMLICCHKCKNASGQVFCGDACENKKTL